MLYELCNVSSSLLNNNLTQALECNVGGTPTNQCIICPNTDIAGIGVRVAFYAQSLFNTLLVIFSPEDAVASAWAGALLTAALVIAGFVQKKMDMISLHHATLVLNYATLSCISSLGIAPILPLWRPHEAYARDVVRQHEGERVLIHVDPDEVGRILATRFRSGHKKRSKVDQTKQRAILSLALLIQVALQWAWGILMFVSPGYYQTACSNDTVLLFFFVPLRAANVNDRQFYVWVLWLLFCLGTTLFLTVILAFSGKKRAYVGLSRRSTLSSATTAATPIHIQLYRAAAAMIPPWRDRFRQLVFWVNTYALVLWMAYIILSEFQIKANCIFSGENEFGGFGQITAVFLAFTPIWSLAVAVYKWPARIRKQRKLIEASRAEAQSLISRSDVHDEDDGQFDEQFEMVALPATRVAAPKRRSHSMPPAQSDSERVGSLRRREVRRSSLVVSPIELQYFPGSHPSLL
ncbi:uncharacterized protein LAESUDRAFT_754731 [Laetiporus sulphureus 93-53]|uniref:Uncharacterized protein n=1 Tax=Laetiporus sulphureus 93-53 TaxID=1314785 RepID=A0A165HVF9_9APHY|nr:uncharacterized protein LAESUDRAFT_754731 [Laetiporus sulphureus 93-53]KZT12241.1 hypothetical protein LAESUDRAFT_754731 [Laetiporus sulphureus 93-53]